MTEKDHNETETTPDVQRQIPLYQFCKAIGRDWGRFQRDFINTGLCTVSVVPGTEFTKHPRILASSQEIEKIKMTIRPPDQTK